MTQYNDDLAKLVALNCIGKSYLGKVIAVTGAPTSGKTTMAETLRLELEALGLRVVVVCTDDHGSLRTSTKDLFDQDGRCTLFVPPASNEVVIVEGVLVPRLIRNGMQHDELVVLSEPVDAEGNSTLSPGHARTWKGMQTVMREMTNEQGE